MNCNTVRSNKYNKVSFGIKVNNDAYSKVYDTQGYNGIAPDSFVMNLLKNNFPDAARTDVLEIASGDGRNTIPIAEEGYNITASEICPEARKLIQNRATDKKLKNIHIRKMNILSHLQDSLNKFHVVIMTHLSQHFNLNEMNQTLKNVHKKIQSGGIFVFDALIRTNKYEDKPCNQKDEWWGNAHYRLSDLEKIAGTNGFDVLGVWKYNEDPKTHAEYIPYWKSKDTSSNEEQLNLEWLVLKKK